MSFTLSNQTFQARGAEPSADGESCSNSDNIIQFTTAQHQHTLFSSVLDSSLPELNYLSAATTLASQVGMNDRKRNSSSLDPVPNPFSASTTVANTSLLGSVTITTAPPSNKKRRVSFCKTSKPPSNEQTQIQNPLNGMYKLLDLANDNNNNSSNNNNMTMKKSTSCTSLPQLASPTALLISQAPTGELDLSISPSAFVKTIVLQSKSITGSIRGEDIITDASQRVTLESYFLTNTHEHLEAYTTDKVNAVSGNDIDTLRALSQEGHLMQASNRFGESVLHTSCRRGFAPIVEFFVNEAKVCPRVRDDMGRTPMHDACWSSSAPNHDIMKLLIQAAPEMLLSKDKRGHSPFDYARREYWPNWVQFLNEHRQFIVNSLVEGFLEHSDQHLTKTVHGEGGEEIGGLADQ